jgi:hypothetical protein
MESVKTTTTNELFSNFTLAIHNSVKPNSKPLIPHQTLCQVSCHCASLSKTDSQLINQRRDMMKECLFVLCVLKRVRDFFCLFRSQTDERISNYRMNSAFFLFVSHLRFFRVNCSEIHREINQRIKQHLLMMEAVC